MIETFFSPATTSFAVAICLLILITCLEVIGLLIGMSPSAAVDSMIPEVDAGIDIDIDAVSEIEFEADVIGASVDADTSAVPTPQTFGPLSYVLGWLSVGKVPILVLLIVFLATFGMLGFLVQGLARSIFGAPLPEIIAVVPALLGAFPAMRFAGLALAGLIPKEQTEAVSQANFVGKVATITTGEARRGLAAEAKVSDQFGQAHYIRVEPDADSERLPQGASIIIVSQSGSIYHAILNTSTAMTD